MNPLTVFTFLSLLLVAIGLLLAWLIERQVRRVREQTALIEAATCTDALLAQLDHSSRVRNPVHD